MATMSPPAHTYGRRRTARHAAAPLCIAFRQAAKLPDGAVPRVSEDDIRRRTQATAASWRRSSATYAMRCAARTAPEAAAASNKAIARNLASTVHGATRRERERRAEAARAAEARAARSRALRYDALEEPFLGL